MKISYSITCYNEHKELDRLLSHLSQYVRPEDEVVIIQDISIKNAKSVIQTEVEELEKVLSKYDFQVHQFEFKKDFAELKNFAKSKCSGDFIFSIDADEIPNPILMEQLPTILEINDTDLIWVPRINIVNDITDWHLKHWGWNQTEKGWINFPDYQARIFRNVDHIKWVRPVHEIIDGAKTYSHLPPHEELTLLHEKDIRKQEFQNKLYDTIL